MKKLCVYVTAIMICSLTLSCESTQILSASFEGDAINGPPTKNLPGNPSGDQIDFDNILVPRLKVQNDVIAGAKALHFTNVTIDNITASQRWLSFRGVATNLSETLWFTHTGQNTGNGDGMWISVSDGYGHNMATLVIKGNGDVGLATSLGDPGSNIIGNVGNDVHTIVFTTSPKTLKYNVSIFKSSGPAITAENKPMLTTDVTAFNNPAHPMISFQHAGTSGPSHMYAIGSVSIKRKKP